MDRVAVWFVRGEVRVAAVRGADGRWCPAVSGSRGAPETPERALGALAIYDMIYNMPRIYNMVLRRIYNLFLNSP